MRHFRLGGGTALVQKPAPHGNDLAHVFGGLESPLDLEGMYAHFDQLRNVLGKREILEGKGIFAACIGQTAGLGALAAVAAAPADKRREQTLPRVRHAKRAVHEYLQLQLAFGKKALHIRLGAFARDDHARKAELLQLGGGKRIVARTLGAGVQLEIRECRVNGGGGTEIGDDERINAAKIGLLCHLNGAGKLAVGDQRVQREIGLGAKGVAKLHGLAHCVGGEVGGAQSRVEISSAEINGIRARIQRGGKRLGRARGSQELGELSHTERRSPKRSSRSSCSYFCVICCSSGEISISGSSS